METRLSKKLKLNIGHKDLHLAPTLALSLHMSLNCLVHELREDRLKKKELGQNQCYNPGFLCYIVKKIEIIKHLKSSAV